MKPKKVQKGKIFGHLLIVDSDEDYFSRHVEEDETPEKPLLPPGMKDPDEEKVEKKDDPSEKEPPLMPPGTIKSK